MNNLWLRVTVAIAVAFSSSVLVTSYAIAEDNQSDTQVAVAESDAATPPDETTENAQQDEKQDVKPQLVELADGKLILPVPGNWKIVKPRNRIIQHEFSVELTKGDETTAGRMTIMSAGGGVEANIARWEGQFNAADGKPLGEEAKKVAKKQIAGLDVHLVDLSGDFQDSPRGPFGPKVTRPGYRMLAAIVPLEQGGTWFIKLYGPQATIKTVEKQFATMIAGLQHKP